MDLRPTTITLAAELERDRSGRRITMTITVLLMDDGGCHSETWDVTVRICVETFLVPPGLSHPPLGNLIPAPLPQMESPGHMASRLVSLLMLWSRCAFFPAGKSAPGSRRQP